MPTLSRRDLLKSAALVPAAAALQSRRHRVVVVGAGAFGGWTALHLRQRGHEVTLLDAYGPGNSRSSSAGGETRVLGEHVLGPAFAGWQGKMLEVTYPPGAESAAHQHPGPTFGFVVSGRIKWAINGGAPQVLEPGMGFFEPMGSVHSTAANASATEPARLSIVILGKPGDELSKPAPEASGIGSAP